MSEPIVPGFYPDPTICRVGEDYYLAHSSFEYFPGAPIWHSRDLIRWTQLGHILDRRSQSRRGDGRSSGGLYAGTLRYHDGRFWYVTTNCSDFYAGQLVVQAIDPAGPWSDPVWVPEAIGIDPDLCWDDVGHCYLTWKAMDFADEEVGILQARLDPATGRLKGPAYPVWQGSGLGAAEGPHLFQAGGYWYLVLAEGGTERGHAVTIARSHHPSGPFEGCPDNPILTHRSTIHPTQNTGHADFVQLADGGWAAVYLAARPRGSTPGFHVLGRETFLAGVDWIDGWPIVNEGQFQVPPVETSFDEQFDRADLHPRWVVPGGEPAASVRRLPGGGIVVLPEGTGSGGATGAAGLLCTRVRDLRWIARATVDSPGRFLLRLDDRHSYGLDRHEDRVEATARIGDLDVIVGSVPVELGPVDLQIEAVDAASATMPLGNAGPDDVVLSVVGRDGPHELARLDGRYLSTEVASGFTGRMLTLASTTEPAHFRALSYRARHNTYPQPVPGSGRATTKEYA